jgi:hypothetical protein
MIGRRAFAAGWRGAGIFEGLGPYLVDEVGDLLMFARGLMVKDASFGFPSPETPDGRRLRRADAWRVWPGYAPGLAG